MNPKYIEYRLYRVQREEVMRGIGAVGAGSVRCVASRRCTPLVLGTFFSRSHVHLSERRRGSLEPQLASLGEASVYCVT